MEPSTNVCPARIRNSPKSKSADAKWRLRPTWWPDVRNTTPTVKKLEHATALNLVASQRTSPSAMATKRRPCPTWSYHANEGTTLLNFVSVAQKGAQSVQDILKTISETRRQLSSSMKGADTKSVYHRSGKDMLFVWCNFPAQYPYENFIRMCFSRYFFVFL